MIRRGSSGARGEERDRKGSELVETTQEKLNSWSQAALKHGPVESSRPSLSLSL